MLQKKEAILYRKKIYLFLILEAKFFKFDASGDGTNIQSILKSKFIDFIFLLTLRIDTLFFIQPLTFNPYFLGFDTM